MKPHLATLAGGIDVAFTPLGAPLAHLAGAFGAAISPNEWTRLIARLGEIPNPTVSNRPSAAAVPDTRAGAEGAASGNH